MRRAIRAGVLAVVVLAGLTACNELQGIVQVAAGTSHSCAVHSDGTVTCWGYNGAGQLGDGTNTNSEGPVAVSGLTNATSITAGADHTCATRTDNTASCWGNNGNGELGDGTTTDSNTVRRPVVARR